MQRNAEQRQDLNPQNSPLASPPRAPETESLGDIRFRALLGAKQWNMLPPAVQRRFSKRVAAGRTVVYKGTVTSISFSRVGYVFAQVLRIIGSPLPLSRAAGQPTVVTVTEDAASGGQFWTRLFVRERGFPQVIHSVKRFAGPTGLEEAVGFGLVMALRLSVSSQGALVFTSAGYALRIGRFRLGLPSAFTPGSLTVTHQEIDATTFRFTLTLAHVVLGTLVHQEAVYNEEAPA
ncbi:MAG: DUF4166 domain-containing protein [Hyphomicrobiaceae bacterium]|nr:DUF4166 domain-containing protein [Hyphomicrobiaceae bacterium]